MVDVAGGVDPSGVDPSGAELVEVRDAKCREASLSEEPNVVGLVARRTLLAD